MIITIFIWFQNNRFIKLDMRTLVTLPVVLFFTVFDFCKYVHLIIVEGVHVSGKVIDVECNFLTKLKVRNFKHEPEGVTSSVGVGFH